MSEITDKLDELEKRVSELKDWKRKYEEDKRRWDAEREHLQKRAGATQKLKEALIDFLELAESALLDAEKAAVKSVTKETLNLNHKELVVNLAHEGKELNMTTGTVMGKVLFCTLTELSKDGFSEAELSETLKEHGWNIGRNTLAPTLGGLVRDGYLVRLEVKPAKYRLPAKVKLNVREEGRKEV